MPLNLKHEGVDCYHRYAEDIALFAELGFTVFRSRSRGAGSSRNGDEEYPNQAGLAFYDRVLDELERHGSSRSSPSATMRRRSTWRSGFTTAGPTAG